MQNGSSNNLDKIARRVLYLLSSKQFLSVSEIAKQLSLDEQQVIAAIQTLGQLGYALGEEKFKISPEGVDYINKKGMAAPKTKESGKKSDQENKIPVFGSVKDLVIWFSIFSILVLLLFAVIFLIVWNVESPALRIICIVLFLAVWTVLLFILLKGSLIRVPEYERRVIFRMGKMLDSRGPGLIIILPMLDDAKTVDMRIKTSEVPHLTCITQDNIQVEVDFVFLWKIKEPTKSISQVKESEESIRLLASAILRTVIAQFIFDDVINKRDSINDMLKNNINKTCEEWGILITKMELREIKPPDDILQAMHRRKEADWNSLATVKNAEAQAEALRLLSEIAKAVDENTMNLKYLEMLKELGQGESTKYVLPMELTNLVRPLIKVLSEKATEKAIQSGGEEISDALRASGTDSDSQQSSNISKLDWPGS